MSIATEITRLNTNKEALATAKTAIASAITTKGGTVASGDGFADFATDIASIPSGGSAPAKGFVPTAWDNAGYVTEGDVYGMTSLPDEFLGGEERNKGQYQKLVTVRIHSNITSLGTDVFGYDSVFDIPSLPDTITSIGQRCFRGCSALSIENLPANLVYINSFAFLQCYNIRIKEFPQGTKEIAESAFEECNAITELTFSDSIESIGNNAFWKCLGLKEVRYLGTPTNLNRPFTLCDNLIDIYVPWAEGEGPSGAPWGATNATIHYNYTPEV